MKRLLFIMLTLSVAIWGCENTQKETTNESNGWDHTVKVAEVIQTSNYTYLDVEENGKRYWMAIAKNNVAPGQLMYYNSGLPMSNFESKELDRIFEQILFVQVVSDNPNPESTLAPMERAMVNKSAGEKKQVEIAPVTGGLTLEQVYDQREQLAGKEIVVKGIVTKYNPAILNRNWLHIQDGTEKGKNYDLTITTNDETKVGEIVVFKGTLNLNVDFGSGYAYDLILENATLQKEM
ncbi:MAG: SH3-like domain-containing protein [Bacteroidetes bacterium]|jgi:hypothetical protein|nr:SH3-like domain-containing protein [Bacteroidota bacterium]